MGPAADNNTVKLNPIVLRVVQVSVFAMLAGAAGGGASWAAAHGVPTSGRSASVNAARAVPLIVPNVRNLAFVFAKGELEDAGFAWKVSGRVHGFPANVVVKQKPAPGTRLVVNGSPRIVLTLKRAKGYPQSGQAEDVSPYPSSRPVPAGRAS